MVENAGFRSARTTDTGVRVTADKLETLPGMTFQTFMNSYASRVITLTSGSAASLIRLIALVRCRPADGRSPEKRGFMRGRSVTAGVAGMAA
jgi:hypothetical protein